MSTNIPLKNVRLSFPKLFKATSFEEGGTLKYSSSFIIDASTEAGKALVVKLKAEIKTACEERWGVGKVPKIKEDHKALFKAEDSETYEELGEDVWILRSSDQRPPVIIDRHKNPIDEDTAMREDKLYAGCYVNGLISFWTYDHKKGKGYSANLKAVQWKGDGERFGGGEPIDPDDFFDDLGDEEEDTTWDDDL